MTVTHFLRRDDLLTIFRRLPPMAEPEIEPLTAEEARSILSLARERRNDVRWAIALALGLRQGEALA